MTIETIGAAPAVSSAPANASLGQDDFLKILLTQLQFQDPLKPMDNQQFIAQMAQFSSLELAQQQNDKTTTLLTIQSATQALSLIGKEVQVETSSSPAFGQVIAVAFENGTPVMTVRTGTGEYLRNIRLSQVSLVELPATGP